MRILINGINYAPELTGVGKYTGEMAESLAAAGHDVRVVTAPPYYPAWRISPGYQAWAYTRERIQGVEVFRCPLWVMEQPSGLQRLLHLFSFAVSSAFVMLAQIFWKPDVVIAVEPPLLCSPMVLLVSWLSGARSWLHIQDFEVDAAFELDSLPRGGLVQYVAESFEHSLLRRFDCVSSISPQMLERAVLKGVSPERTWLFPNWVDTECIYPCDSSSRHWRAALGIAEGDTVVLYSGNMGGKQGLTLLLDAASALEDEPSIRFVLCGAGTARTRLEKLAVERQLKNVQFLPLQPVERLNELLNLADVHALIQRDAPADLVMPSKLGGMLASGRAVLATARPGTAISNVLKEAKCGEPVPPEDAEAFVRSLRRLAANPQRRARLGANGRAYALAHFTRQQILAEFEAQLTGLSQPVTAVPALSRNS